MMILIQAGPAHTVNYMIAGFAVIFGFMGLYLLSMAIRRRNLERDFKMLKNLSNNGE
jgi:hypothetical protein